YSGPATEPQLLDLSAAVDGAYVISGTGTGAGPYRIIYTRYTTHGEVIEEAVWEGTAAPGVAIAPISVFVPPPDSSPGLEAPEIIAQPVNQIVSPGAAAEFQVTVTGNPPPGFQWQLSADGGLTWKRLTDGFYQGTNSNVLRIPAVSRSQNGDQVRCVA